jgi:hypothetical protein
VVQTRLAELDVIWVEYRCSAVSLQAGRVWLDSRRRLRALECLRPVVGLSLGIMGRLEFLMRMPGSQWPTRSGTPLAGSRVAIWRARDPGATVLA